MYLGEKGVEAVDLLSLLNIRVVLGYSAQCQLLHEVNLVWSVHVLLLSDR